MAKRCDQMNAMAVDREAGAEILTLKNVKAFSVSLGDIRRVRETKKDGTPGRVIKQVHLLNCSCRIAGRQKPIEMTFEMEAGDNYGFSGELKQCVLPAVERFVTDFIRQRLTELKEEEAPLGDAPPPLPSQRGKSLFAKAKGGGGIAAQAAARREANTTNNTEQFDEAAHPDPEKGGEA